MLKKTLWFSAFAGLAATLSVVVSAGGARVFLVFAVMAAGVAVCRLPIHTLPSIALVLFAFVPLAYMQVPVLVGRFFTPPVIVLLVWAIRTLLKSKKATFTFWNILGWALALGLTVSTAFSIDQGRSASWALTALICIVLVGAAAKSADSLSSHFLFITWSWVAILLGAFAIVEFLAKSNPAAEWYYAARDLTAGSNWSVYRVRTMLGHPLMNALFFAPTAAVMLFRFVSDRKITSATAGLLSLVALVLTASRGALFAFIVAACVSVPFILFAARLRAAWKFLTVLALPLILVGAYLSPQIQSRISSGEASAGQRNVVIDQALRLYQEGRLFGSGPGTAQTLLTRSGIDLLFENSILQALIGLGLTSFVLLLIIFLVAGIYCIRCGNTEAALGLLAYLIAVGGFNIWDAYPGSMVIVAALLVIGFRARTAEDTALDSGFATTTGAKLLSSKADARTFTRVDRS